jgi:hypothetical protein
LDIEFMAHACRYLGIHAHISIVTFGIYGAVRDSGREDYDISGVQDHFLAVCRTLQRPDAEEEGRGTSYDGWMGATSEHIKISKSAVLESLTVALVRVWVKVVPWDSTPCSLK